MVDANRPRLEVYTDETPWTPPNVHPQDPMGFWSSTQDEVHTRPKTRPGCRSARPAQSDAAYFLDRLDADRDSEINVVEAALATEVLLAAYRSAATREVVTLPLARKSTNAPSEGYAVFNQWLGFKARIEVSDAIALSVSQFVQHFPERELDGDDHRPAIEDNMSRSVLSALANADGPSALAMFLQQLGQHAKAHRPASPH